MSVRGGAFFGNEEFIGIGGELTASEEAWVQSGNVGILLFSETTAPSPVSGIGKVYVKNSDRKLYYLDGSGNETSLVDLIIGKTITSGTSGSILYIDSNGNLAQDNPNLFYDATNARLGLETTTPDERLEVFNGNLKLGDNANAARYLMFERNSVLVGTLNTGNNRLQIHTDTLAVNSLSGATNRLIISSTGLGIGVTPAVALDSKSTLQIRNDGSETSFQSASYPRLYDSTGTGGAFPFLEYGNLVIQPRTDAARNIAFATYNGTSIASRVVIQYDGKVIIGGTSPDASAILHLSSTSKGFLPPVMTGAQVEAISSPANGLMVFASNAGSGAITSEGTWQYQSGGWTKLG